MPSTLNGLSRPADDDFSPAAAEKLVSVFLRRAVFQKGHSSVPRVSLLFPFLVSFLLVGCGQVREAPPQPPPPGETVTYYLKGMFNPTMQRELYDLLTAEARKPIPYANFLSLRDGEVSRLVGGRTATDTHVFVSLFDQYDFSSDHSVVYALLTVRHPYSIGERETYALVRLHCLKEGGHWAIQPFMHAKTGSIFLVPTRVRGPLWRISKDMERIASTVKDDISHYEGQKGPPSEEPELPEVAEEPPLTKPDVVETESVAPASLPLENQKKVDALLSIGRLCYEVGKVDAAEDTFRRALALDSNNVVARDYISRCENYRLLQKEKEEAVRLMEELLRLESQGRAPK